MAEKKSAGVIKQARKHSKMVGAGLLAAAMSPALMAKDKVMQQLLKNTVQHQ